MKISITTDDGEVLDIISGSRVKLTGGTTASDGNFCDRDGDPKDPGEFGEIVKAAVVVECDAMRRRGRPL